MARTSRVALGVFFAIVFLSIPAAFAQADPTFTPDTFSITGFGRTVTLTVTSPYSDCTMIISAQSTDPTIATVTPAGPVITTGPVTYTLTAGTKRNGKAIIIFLIASTPTGCVKAYQYNIPFFLNDPTPVRKGTIPQIAAGGPWYTRTTLYNRDTVPVKAVMNLWGDNGAPLPLQLTSPQGIFNPVTASTLSQTLNPGAQLVVQFAGPATQPVQVGWADLLTNGDVTGFTVFSSVQGNNVQQAVVPLEDRSPGAFLVSFDNTNNNSTGVALANTSTGTANIGVIVSDDTGKTLVSNSISLPGGGHSSFFFADNYPVTAQRMGTVEFDVPTNGQFSVLGLQFSPSGSFSSVPAITK